MSWLIAQLAAFGRLSESRGYLVAKSAGVSLVRLSWPVFVVGVLLTAGDGVLQQRDAARGQLPHERAVARHPRQPARVRARRRATSTPASTATRSAPTRSPQDDVGPARGRDGVRDARATGGGEAVLTAAACAPRDAVRRPAPDHAAGGRRDRTAARAAARPTPTSGWRFGALPHGVRPVHPGRLRAPRARRRQPDRPLDAHVRDGRASWTRSTAAPQARADSVAAAHPRGGRQDGDDLMLDVSDPSRHAARPSRPRRAASADAMRGSGTARAPDAGGAARRPTVPSARRPRRLDGLATPSGRPSTTRPPPAPAIRSAAETALASTGRRGRPTATASRSTKRTRSRWRAWCSCSSACRWGCRSRAPASGSSRRSPSSCFCSTGSRSCRARSWPTARCCRRGSACGPPTSSSARWARTCSPARRSTRPGRDPIRALAGRFSRRD